MMGETQIKNLLIQARSQLQEEVSGLLGATLRVTKPQLRRISKTEYFSEPGKNLVLTRVAVNGDLETEIAILIRLQDAILLGGTLIMLPTTELEQRIKTEKFGEEEADAFGEIANIITGALNTSFAAVCTEKLHLKKIDLLAINCDDLDPESDQPFPPQEFILGTYPLVLEKRNLGNLEILFPMAFIENNTEPSSTREPSVDANQPADLEAIPVDSSDKAKADQATDSPPAVLILADHECNIEKFSLALQMNQCTYKRLGLQEDIKEFLQRHGGLKCVILIMGDVSDRGLAAAIQIRSTANESLPIIAAGSHWTKSKVLQAVKFGVKDILAIPLSTDDIRSKISSYLD